LSGIHQNPLIRTISSTLNTFLPSGGNQTDENYLFYQAEDIKLDSQDNIYALDSGNFRIQVFYPNGKYLRTIGIRRQGPGEFSNFIYNFDISEKDYIYVCSGKFITRFTSDGQYDECLKHIKSSLKNNKRVLEPVSGMLRSRNIMFF